MRSIPSLFSNVWRICFSLALSMSDLAIMSSMMAIYVTNVCCGIEVGRLDALLVSLLESLCCGAMTLGFVALIDRTRKRVLGSKGPGQRHHCKPKRVSGFPFNNLQQGERRVRCGPTFAESHDYLATRAHCFNRSDTTQKVPSRPSNQRKLVG